MEGRVKKGAVGTASSAAFTRNRSSLTGASGFNPPPMSSVFHGEPLWLTSHTRASRASPVAIRRMHPHAELLVPAKRCAQFHRRHRRRAHHPTAPLAARGKRRKIQPQQILQRRLKLLDLRAQFKLQTCL